MTGVPTGYTHNWAYHGNWREKKIKPGVWKVTFTATKGRGGSSRGGPPIGTKINWKFGKVRQTARKISGRKYQTKLTAYKYLNKIKTPRRY